MSQFRLRGDVCQLDLHENEAKALRRLLGEFRASLDEDKENSYGEGKIWFLHPPGHVGDKVQELKFQLLIEEDLYRSRLAALKVVNEGLIKGEFGVADCDAWMRTLTAVRMVLGSQLGLSNARDADNELPDTPLAGIYEWTGILLEQLVGLFNSDDAASQADDDGEFDDVN